MGGRSWKKNAAVLSEALLATVALHMATAPAGNSHDAQCLGVALAPPGQHSRDLGSVHNCERQMHAFTCRNLVWRLCLRAGAAGERRAVFLSVRAERASGAVLKSAGSNGPVSCRLLKRGRTEKRHVDGTS